MKIERASMLSDTDRQSLGFQPHRTITEASFSLVHRHSSSLAIDGPVRE